MTRAWRALEELSERREAPYALVCAALLVYAVGALAFPLAAGRDLGTYVRASFELRQAEVVLPQAPVDMLTLSFRNRIANNSVLVPRELFARHGMYDPHVAMRRLTDWVKEKWDKNTPW